MADEDNQQTDEEIVANLPPRDGSSEDPAANAAASLEDVNMDEQREALKQIQKDIPSSGE